MTTFQDIVNLIAQWKQLVASAPANLQPQIQTMLQRQTPNNPPGANTVQGIIQYYSGHPPFTGQAYIDRDFGTFSQAVADLQNLLIQLQQTMMSPTTIAASSALDPAYLPPPTSTVSGNTLLIVGILGISLLVLPIILFKLKL